MEYIRVEFVAQDPYPNKMGMILTEQEFIDMLRSNEATILHRRPHRITHKLECTDVHIAEGYEPSFKGIYRGGLVFLATERWAQIDRVTEIF